MKIDLTMTMVGPRPSKCLVISLICLLVVMISTPGESKPSPGNNPGENKANLGENKENLADSKDASNVGENKENSTENKENLDENKRNPDYDYGAKKENSGDHRLGSLPIVYQELMPCGSEYDENFGENNVSQIHIYGVYLWSISKTRSPNRIRISIQTLIADIHR